jgi:hypothetical protein
MSPTHYPFDIRRATPTQPEDIQPTPIRLFQDTVRPAIPSIIVIPDAASTSSASTSSAALASGGSASPAAEPGMSNAMKLGLAIPVVVVVLTGLYILFLFWYRKRRAARKPPVPEKDDVSSGQTSVAGRQRSSKVWNMAAFITPLHGPHQQPAASKEAYHGLALPGISKKRNVNVTAAPSSPDLAAMHYVPAPARKKDQNNIHINLMAAASCPNMRETDLDSPIDVRSPFRLKRGDTVKRRGDAANRHSLGNDLFRLWPTPPTSTYLKPMSVNDEMQERGSPLGMRSQWASPASRFSAWGGK